MSDNYKLSNNEIINKYELINVINHEKILKKSIEMLLIRLDILRCNTFFYNWRKIYKMV